MSKNYKKKLKVKNIKQKYKCQTKTTIKNKQKMPKANADQFQPPEAHRVAYLPKPRSPRKRHDAPSWKRYGP